MLLEKQDNHMQRTNLNPYPTPYTKLNSKRVKDLYLRPKSMQFLEENIDVNLYDVGLYNGFLGYQKHK